MVSVAIYLLTLGFFICLVLGANNASACFSTSVGAGFVKYSIAAGLASIGVILGLLLEGMKLSGTISGGILEYVNVETTLILIVSMLIVMTLATLIRLPLSLSTVLVGSAVGVGLSTGTGINWKFTSIIVFSWIATPISASLLSIILYKIVFYITYSVKRLLTLSYLYSRVTLLLSFYVAYVLGANTVGLISGIFNSIVGRWISMLILGVATSLGIYFLSRGVTESVGKGIIGLSPSTALVAQLSGALTVHLFTQFGIPVSITQAIIGGVIGIGSAKRIALMNIHTIKKILLAWLLAPIVGVVISYVITILL